MQLNQIRYFLEVAKHLNFTAAAKASAVSQPALSNAIQKLEADLGTNLFDRNSQQVELTEFGHTMKYHFELIESNLHKARDAANTAVKKGIEKLNIGIMCTIGPHHFAKFLKKFRNRFSDIDLILHDVTIDMIPEMLISGGLDCVICARLEKLDKRFQVIDLLEEEMVIAFSKDHKFNKLDRVSVEAIAAEPYLDRLHCEFRDSFLSFIQARGVMLDVALSSEREDWVLELISNGLGISVLPLSTAKLGAVEYRPVDGLSSIRNLKIVMANNSTPPPRIAAIRVLKCERSLRTQFLPYIRYLLLSSEQLPHHFLP